MAFLINKVIVVAQCSKFEQKQVEWSYNQRQRGNKSYKTRKVKAIQMFRFEIYNTRNN